MKVPRQLESRQTTAERSPGIGHRGLLGNTDFGAHSGAWRPVNPVQHFSGFHISGHGLLNNDVCVLHPGPESLQPNSIAGRLTLCVKRRSLLASRFFMVHRRFWKDGGGSQDPFRKTERATLCAVQIRGGRLRSTAAGYFPNAHSHTRVAKKATAATASTAAEARTASVSAKRRAVVSHAGASFIGALVAGRCN